MFHSAWFMFHSAWLIFLQCACCSRCRSSARLCSTRISRRFFGTKSSSACPKHVFWSCWPASVCRWPRRFWWPPCSAGSVTGRTRGNRTSGSCWSGCACLCWTWRSSPARWRQMSWCRSVRSSDRCCRRHACTALSDGRCSRNTLDPAGESPSSHPHLNQPSRHRTAI